MLAEDFVKLANEKCKSIWIDKREYKLNWKINGPDKDVVSCTIDRYYNAEKSSSLANCIASKLDVDPNLLSLNATYDSFSYKTGMEFSISPDSIPYSPFRKKNAAQPSSTKSSSSNWMTFFSCLALLVPVPIETQPRPTNTNR